MNQNIKKLIPPIIRTGIKRLLQGNKQHDPVDEAYSEQNIGDVFSAVYNNDEWAQGTEQKYKAADAKFYSGSGSYNRAAGEYIVFISNFIQQNNITSVTDVGCGDFNIGKEICKQAPALRYYGVDIVPDLIAFNNQRYGNERISFHCINTLKEDVPKSGLLLIRQVLQHLSNADVATLTGKAFGSFATILVTEHQLKASLLVKPNVDKASGPNTRLGFGSGVYLDKKPFAYKWRKLLAAADDDNPDCEIVTYQILK